MNMGCFSNDKKKKKQRARDVNLLLLRKSIYVYISVFFFFCFFFFFFFLFFFFFCYSVFIFHFKCVSCLKSDSRTDLPCIELFEREKKNEPYVVRIWAARMISEHRNHKATEAGREKEVIKPIVLICASYVKLFINNLCLECIDSQLYVKSTYTIIIEQEISLIEFI